MNDTAEDNGLTDLSKNKRRFLTPFTAFFIVRSETKVENRSKVMKQQS